MILFKGGALRRARRGAGLSRRRLLDLTALYHGVRVSMETLRRQEDGEADPRWSHAAAYAAVLGVSLETFDARA